MLCVSKNFAIALQSKKNTYPDHLSVLLKIFFVLILAFLSPATHSFAYVILSFWCFLGPKQALESLSLSWLLSFLNPGIFSLSSAIGVLRWLVLISAFSSVFFYKIIDSYRIKRINLPRIWYWILVFVFISTGLSYYSSYAFDVSLLKAISFFITTTTILLAFYSTFYFSTYWRSWFLTFFVVLTLFSAPLLFHHLGYFNNQRSFQGLLNHSQAFGTFVGPLCGWLFALLISREVKGIRWWIFLSIALTTLNFSASRTGMISFLFSLVIVASIKLVQKDFAWRKITKSLVIVLICLILLFPFFLIYEDAISNTAKKMAFKRSRETEIAAAFYVSRGFLVARSWENFRNNMITGIGFGVASNPYEMLVQRDSVFGLPMGAPTEKGFLVFGVLEELGIIGFTFFVLILGSLFYPILKRGGKFSLAVLGTAVFLANFGEATFLSPGGMGLWMWLLLIFARRNCTSSQNYN